MEEAEITFALAVGSDGSDILENIRKAKLKANYPISHLHIKVLQESGKEVYRSIHRTKATHEYAIDMDSCFFPLLIKKYADGKHTLQISCFLGNGETLTAYSHVLEQ